MSNLRLGTFDLEIEKGRYTGIPRDHRFCKICDTKEIENESHFILSCPTLEAIRKPFLDKIKARDHTFNSRDTNSKLIFLYYNNAISDPIQNIAAEMLIELKREKNIQSLRQCVTDINPVAI